MNVIPNMAELHAFSVNRSAHALGDLPETRQWRAGRTFASELGQIDPALLTFRPTEGDVKAQGIRLADVLVFGPLMIYSGLGRTPPPWVKLGLIIIGTGTILYNLHNYILVQRARADAGEPDGVGQMSHGPMHKVADLRRSGGIQDVYTRGPGRLRGRW